MLSFRQRKNAFTLIELLVVISIIALLVSILMPALGKAKDQAKKTVCSANLRSLTMAMKYYCGDNAGKTPMSTNNWNDGGTTKAGWCGVTCDINTGDLFTPQDQIHGFTSEQYTGLEKGQLWKYVESSDMWGCPADPDKNQLRSYCMSAQWWGGHSLAGDMVYYDTATTGLVLKNIDRIKRASERFTFIDQLGMNLDAYFAIWYSQPRWWNIPNFKHSNGSVNAFADGHVDGYKLQLDTVEAAKEAYQAAETATDFKMADVDMPSDDLMYYQRATWGKIGWQN